MPTKTDDLRRRLDALTMNLRWTWDSDAQAILAAVDPPLWRATNHNPRAMLRSADESRLSELGADAAFMRRVDACEARLRRELGARTWFQRAHRRERLLVAYFCSEYAIHESFPQYAGGLGVLAGDHLKSASDLGVPLVALGLLYRSGYYQQAFDAGGATRVRYPHYDYRDFPLRDSGARIDVPIAARTVRCTIWELLVGRTRLLLLDSDVPANRGADRRITDRLYGGEPAHRLEQQVLLGVGGVMALDALRLRPTAYHLNEGHAALAGVERLRRLRAAGRSMQRAIDEVRARTVFTTHTPVPAGHDRYEPKLVARTLAPLGIAADELLALGRERPDDRREWFCMTVAALKLAAHCNGVAKLHGETSRKMWQSLYAAKRPQQVPIGHVTNGVHTQTWLAPEMEPLYARHLRPRWVSAGPRDDWWRRAGRIPAAELWALRNVLRAKLVHFVRERLVEQALRRGAPADEIAEAHAALDPRALTLGFARRFATYKRAPLIFHDAARISAILCDAKRPVQLIFAGKAHPRDLGGQEFARRIVRIARQNGFRGRVAVIENYDMHVGRALTAGCDVWLNNPIRPMEASGTSGMKPPLHGGLNCSILDGWWPEAYDGRNGFAIGDGRELKSQRAQDRYDATCIYELLEREIVPLFYRRDRAGVPQEWARRMKRSMATVCAAFSAHRMVGDYVERYYLPASRGQT